MGVSLVIALLVLIGIIVGVFYMLLNVFSLVGVLGLYFIVVCLLLMLIILIQKPKGGGLSGAFGGAGGGSQAAFGAKTGDVLTVVTVVLFLMFISLGISMTLASKSEIAAGAVPTEVATPDAADETSDDGLPVDDASTSSSTTDAPESPESSEATAPSAGESEASP